MFLSFRLINRNCNIDNRNPTTYSPNLNFLKVGHGNHAENIYPFILTISIHESDHTSRTKQ